MTPDFQNLRECINLILEVESIMEEYQNKDLIEFIVRSNAIEGYEVDPEEVVAALNGEPVYDPHILSHLRGLSAAKDSQTLESALEIHSAMGDNVLDSGASGFLRSGMEVKSQEGKDYAPSNQIPEAMKWWENTSFSSPFERHVAYEVIHPFADGNGRSGRILMAADLGFDFKEVNRLIGKDYINNLKSVGENYMGEFWKDDSIAEDYISRKCLRKIIKEEIIKEISIDGINLGSLAETRSLMNNPIGKLPDFLYAPLEEVIRESRFWFAPNTEDESEMKKTSGGWQNQTEGAIILQSTIQDFLNLNDIKVSVFVVTPQAANNPELQLPVTKDHKLYPNRLVFIGSQDVSDKGGFVMFMLMAPVDKNFDPRDVDPVTISRIIGKIVRHELIHVIQLEKRRRNQKSSRLFAKDEFAKEGEIVDAEDRSGYLGSKIEIDAYAHEFAEELLQKYGKDKSLNILRGLVPIESLDLSDQFREYLENIPGEESSMRLKKKMYSHIVDLASREI